LVPPDKQEKIAMGRLTSHILDTAAGRPAAGMHWVLYRLDGARTQVASGQTNSDGRNDEPVLKGEALVPGVYEFQFDAAGYFRQCGVELPEPPFLGEVVVRFGIADSSAHYHVPLLVSPYGYSTYRGS
tara:strand:- start:1476 stop:1859 length:384 start_codon:yes stop_codon:yes gene_type:complete